MLTFSDREGKMGGGMLGIGRKYQGKRNDSGIVNLTSNPSPWPDR